MLLKSGGCCFYSLKEYLFYHIKNIFIKGFYFTSLLVPKPVKYRLKYCMNSFWYYANRGYTIKRLTKGHNSNCLNCIWLGKCPCFICAGTKKNNWIIKRRAFWYLKQFFLCFASFSLPWKYELIINLVC